MVIICALTTTYTQLLYCTYMQYYTYCYLYCGHHHQAHKAARHFCPQKSPRIVYGPLPFVRNIKSRVIRRVCLLPPTAETMLHAVYYMFFIALVLLLCSIILLNGSRIQQALIWEKVPPAHACMRGRAIKVSSIIV